MSHTAHLKLGDVSEILLSNVDKEIRPDETPVRLCNYTDVYKNTSIRAEMADGFLKASATSNEIKKFKLEKGQVAITKDSETRDDIGVPAYIEDDFDDVLLGYHLALINPVAEKLDGRFLNYFLRTGHLRKYFEFNTSGSGQRCTIALESIKGIPLNIPAVGEQKKIAAVLSALDAKIELNNRINRELEALAKTIYDYWFVQFDFPDENGKPYRSSGGTMTYNEALKREVPEGWEVQCIRDITKCNYRSIVKKDKYQFINYLDTANLTQNVVAEVERIDLSKVSKPQRAQRVVQKNDILYSTVRPNQLHFGIIREPFANMVASSGFVQLTSSDPTISNEFLYLSITSKSNTVRLTQIADLAVSSYPSISPDDLLDLKIPLPENRKLFESINKFLDMTFNQLWNNKEQNRELSRLRDWLLPMLMNGQVTVKK
jgi:type I restriction enzyme, S subunit